MSLGFIGSAGLPAGLVVSAAQRTCKTPFRARQARPEPDLFACDGFHPSRRAHAIAGEEIAAASTAARWLIACRVPNGFAPGPSHAVLAFWAARSARTQRAGSGAG
jgi:hypothetical protein